MIHWLKHRLKHWVVWPLLDAWDWVTRRDPHRVPPPPNAPSRRQRARWWVLDHWDDAMTWPRRAFGSHHARRAAAIAAILVPLTAVSGLAVATALNDGPEDGGAKVVTPKPSPRAAVGGVSATSADEARERAERREREAERRRRVARRERAARRRAVARRRARERAAAAADAAPPAPQTPPPAAEPPPATTPAPPPPRPPAQAPSPPPPSGNGGGGGGSGGGNPSQPAPGVQFDDEG